MSYIGNTAQNQSYAPGIDYFSGNGSTVAFTLSRPVNVAAEMLVFVANVPQNPSTAFTVSGNTITFTSAPPSGTNNIWVEYTSLITNTIVPGQKTVGTNELSATGTPSSTTFLAGDNTWQTITIPPSGGPGVLQSVQTSNFTVVANNVYAVNTTAGAITATLPASPTAGQYVTFIDYARTFATNNLIINPNGNKAAGTTVNTVLTYSGSQVTLIYVDSTQGWLQASGSQSTFIGGYSVNYLVVAGGGGGGNYNSGGGGGAGGLLASSATLVPGTNYTITVGAGGGAAAAGPGYGQTAGNNSSLGTIATAIGGGFGAGNNAVTSNGGSGGGGCTSNTSGGLGTAGQGNNGGWGWYGTNYPGGGGGGAGAAGGVATSSSPAGSGGAGLQSSISGTPTYYAGGGGGSCQVGGTGGTGGSGGGGTGGDGSTLNGTSGTTNRGGGGGAGGYVSGTGTGASGAGGSGIVIISYAGSQRGTGGTVTSVGGNTIHTFTASGTFTA